MTWAPKTQQNKELSTASNPLLVRVGIKMARKGTPLVNALISLQVYSCYLVDYLTLNQICEPTEEDCLRWKMEGLSTSTLFPVLPKRKLSKDAPQPMESKVVTSTTTKATKKQLKEANKRQKEADLNCLLNGVKFWDIHHSEAPHRNVIGESSHFLTIGCHS
jgi:hypothetical protein